MAPEDATFVEPGFVDPGFVADVVVPRYGPFEVNVLPSGAPFSCLVLTPDSEVEELS